MSLIINSGRVNASPVAQKRTRGFTLLEALLGFLILSIGMLGIASLQTISLKSGKTSVYGSMAMLKAEELLESMRANPTAEALAEYASSSTANGTDNGCTSGATCTPVELAQDDVYWWKKNITTDLAGASTRVTFTPAVAPSMRATVLVDVSWSERSEGNSVTRRQSTTADICTNLPMAQAC